MHLNRALLESSGITRHFMSPTERQTKKALCKLLIDKGHRKYAERFWKFDFNIIDAKKHPEFTAAISFDEATVFISSGFLGNGEGIFNQLDVLLRHELAHNLMMHQIRMMYVFKKKFAHDPDKIYERIRYSQSLHTILNIIEDFEISNKRYSEADKNIVRNMTLNGELIGGLVTEDDRGWEKLSLEAMYEEISKELDAIHKAIRSNPYWAPKSKTVGSRRVYDPIDVSASGIDERTRVIAMYRNENAPSVIKAPIDVFIKSKSFKNYPEVIKSLVINVYNAVKDCTSDADIQKLLKMVSEIAETSPQETYDIINPQTGELVETLYTPEEKLFATAILKNLAGKINYDPLKFKVKRKTNSQAYKNSWNETIKKLDSSKFDDETLQKLRDALAAM